MAYNDYFNTADGYGFSAPGFSTSAPAQFVNGSQYSTKDPSGGTNLPNGYPVQDSGWQHAYNLSNQIYVPQDGPDLENVTADLSAVADMPASDFTSGIHDGPWQPRSFPVPMGTVKGRAASDPTLLIHTPPNLASSYGDADMVDSGFGSLQPSPLYPGSHLLQRPQSQHNGGFAVPSLAGSATKRPRSFKSQTAYPQAPLSTASSRRRSSFVPHMCEVPGCDRMLSNRSEQTKHIKQHSKPYKCVVPECPKATEGFGTPNDAKRHMRDRHKMRMPNDVGYICKLCPYLDGSPKWWTRKDNFKNHIEHKHQGEDVETVLRASYQSCRPDDAVSEIGTAISAHPSNYHSQSHPDSEVYYQYDFSITSASQPATVLQNQSHFQGEILSMDAAMDSILQSDELAGLGTAHADDRLPLHRHIGPCRPSWQSTEPTVRFEHDATSTDVSDSENIPARSSSFQGHQKQAWAKSLINHNKQIPSKTIDQDCDRPMKRKRQDSESDTDYKRTAQQRHICMDCGKHVTNVKKHNMRHTRPFICTDPRCFMRFGSKNDWIRHESALHRLPESYICTLPHSDGSPGPCNTYFDMEDRFRQHLWGPKHLLPSTEVDDIIDDMRLGQDGEVRFWCGHCSDVIKNPNLDEEAWKYRCQHIGKHLDEAQGAHGKNWVCVFIQKAKKDISEKQRSDLKQMKLRPGQDEDYSPQRAFEDQLRREAIRIRARARARLEQNTVKRV